MEATDKRRHKRGAVERLDPKVFKALCDYVAKHKGTPLTKLHKDFFSHHPHLTITYTQFRDWYKKWNKKVQDEVNKLINTLPSEIATDGLEMGVMLKQVDQMVVGLANVGLKGEWDAMRKGGNVDMDKIMGWFFRLSQLKVSQGFLAHKMERASKHDEMMEGLLNRSRYGAIDPQEIIDMEELNGSENTGTDEATGTDTEGGVAEEDSVGTEG